MALGAAASKAHRGRRTCEDRGLESRLVSAMGRAALDWCKIGERGLAEGWRRRRHRGRYTLEVSHR